MKTAEQPRKLSVILEEISDLQSYLGNLPPAVRNSGAFASYESRLSALNKELSNAKNYGIHSNEDINSEDSPISIAEKIYVSLNDKGQNYLLSEAQVVTYEKLTKQKSDMSALNVFSEFLASLTKEQWLHIFTVFGCALLVGIASKKILAKESAITNVNLLNLE